jgi:hypothetical protein
MAYFLKYSPLKPFCQMNRNLVGNILPVAAMFVKGSGRNSNLYRGPSIDGSYQVSVHLAEGF